MWQQTTGLDAACSAHVSVSRKCRHLGLPPWYLPTMGLRISDDRKHCILGRICHMWDDVLHLDIGVASIRSMSFDTVFTCCGAWSLAALRDSRLVKPLDEGHNLEDAVKEDSQFVSLQRLHWSQGKRITRLFGILTLDRHAACGEDALFLAE